MCTYLKEAEDDSSHGGRGESATSGAQLGADPPPVPGSPRGAAPRGARTPRTHGAPARRCVPARLPGARGEEPTRPVKREKATQIWGGGGGVGSAGGSSAGRRPPRVRR